MILYVGKLFHFKMFFIRCHTFTISNVFGCRRNSEVKALMFEASLTAMKLRVCEVKGTYVNTKLAKHMPCNIYSARSSPDLLLRRVVRFGIR